MANAQEQFNEALQLHQAGRIIEAIDLYTALLPQMQDKPQLLFLLGSAQLQAGELESSIDLMARALRQEPQNVFAHINQGNALQGLGRHAKAVAAFERALALRPELAEVHNNRGVSLLRLGRLEEALTSFERALSVHPDYAEAHNNRGHALKKLKRDDQALASFERALALNPDYAEAHNNRGVVLDDLGRAEEALAANARALALHPDYAEAHNNRGVVLVDLGRAEEALAANARALALNPDCAEAHNNRGNILRDLGRVEESLVSYDQALALDPDYGEAHWNKSLLLILTGQYLKGWELYEWRLKGEDAYIFPQPGWRGGEDIAGKRILVYGEQGFGDVIQFCRYLPQIRALGAEIVFEAPKPLVSLVSTMDCPMTLVARGEPLPGFDVYCPLMSLPYAFATTVETIPADIPYLHADAGKLRRWEQRLGDTERLRVGLVWSGSTVQKKGAFRSMLLEDLLPLIDLPVEWHSLQVEYRQPDLELLARHPEIRQHQDALHDFSDTAALIACMDLVISVDTGVAHVAGAMGKPVWIMLPFAPDYRWMLDRDDSPWYPTARLFRQSSPGDWNSVIAEVVQAMQELDASD